MTTKDEQQYERQLVQGRDVLFDALSKLKKEGRGGEEQARAAAHK
jgi:hypothetical protein